MSEDRHVPKAVLERIRDALWQNENKPYGSDGLRRSLRLLQLGDRLILADGTEAVVVPLNATRAMTIAAEKLGAGEAWAEDCWRAMLAALAKDS